jgi:hypothetical protein
MKKQKNTELDTTERVLKAFKGRDPIKELSERMQTMKSKQLRDLVLISCNRIGTIIKSGEYEDSYDALLHINLGADILLDAYDNAQALMLQRSKSKGNA